jgi:hypothetical protein
MTAIRSGCDIKKGNDIGCFDLCINSHGGSLLLRIATIGGGLFTVTNPLPPPAGAAGSLI